MNKDISHNNNGIKKSGDIDYFVVMLGSIMLLAIVVAIVVNQEWSENVIGNSFGFITNEFGIAYRIVLDISRSFLVLRAFGKHGEIVLGGIESNEYYS